MLPHLRWIPLCSLALLAGPLLACSDDDLAGDDDSSADTATEGDDGTDTSASDTDTGGEEIESATITHRFGEYSLSPFEETSPCVQWTLDNDAPIYAQAVTLSNLGYFHHSNWFVVPEELYPGEDGYFNCGSRDFTELGAATAGTVLFAQSTQSFAEEQRTAEGAVIKIPAGYKVIGGLHMLNVGPAEVDTDLFMSLELIHPRHVDVTLTPFRLSYLDLDIPANTQSRFTGACDDFGATYEGAAGQPINMKLHYVLPHYHYLGNYFSLAFSGGDIQGEKVYELNGFNGEANGHVFDPPLDLTGVEGIRYTCGYDNWRDVNVGWGIGDQEMCVMLGFAESRILMDITVTGGTKAVGESDGILEYEGPCAILAIAKNPAQGPPTSAETEGPFNVPESGEDGVPPVPQCSDHDTDVPPTLEPTLTNIANVVFAQSCTFNACHGDSAQASGLNLQAPDLLAELLGHESLTNPGASLVEPGDPDNSWLYQIMAQCEPGGATGNHMPLNSPVLLDDASLSMVREWIAGGALDN